MRTIMDITAYRDGALKMCMDNNPFADELCTVCIVLDWVLGELTTLPFNPAPVWPNENIIETVGGAYEHYK